MTINTTTPDRDTDADIHNADIPAPDAGPTSIEEIVADLPFATEPPPVEGVPVVSDEELEKQALAHPGADGDPSTPE